MDVVLVSTAVARLQCPRRPQVKNPAPIGADGAILVRFWCWWRSNGAKLVLAPFFENREFQQPTEALFIPKDTNDLLT
jgi:hypothetical protein